MLSKTQAAINIHYTCKYCFNFHRNSKNKTVAVDYFFNVANERRYFKCKAY